jgi:hypothetical protein
MFWCSRGKLIHGLVLLFGLPSVEAPAQAVQNFILTDVRTGKSVSLNDFNRYPAIVLIFTSNTCAFDRHYRKRILDMILTYENRVPFLLINSYTKPDETVEKMKALAAESDFSVPYLADKKQEVMQSLGVRKSPECVVLQPSSGGFRIVYRGAIDDNPQMAEAVLHFYLRDAIEQVLNNQTVTVRERVPVGCAIH